MKKQIRANLTYLRLAHGRLSQKAVSEATGIGQKTLSALETGASKGIDFNTLIRLCDFFRCSLSDLLIIEEVPEEEPIPDEIRQRAKELVARGLKAAMEAPPSDPEEIWAQFDAVRRRLQASAERAQDTTKQRRSTNGA